MKRSEIDTEAKRLCEMGIKWKHLGRDTVQADCVGFVQLVGQRFDVPYEDRLDYGKLPDGWQFVEHLRHYLTLGSMPLKLGQIAVLRDELLPCHCGIITERHGEFRLTHSSAAHRKVTESNLDPNFWASFRMVLEFPGVEED